MDVQLVHADLLDQNVDVIVNAWNRNIIPWWLLLPHLGSYGAIGPDNLYPVEQEYEDPRGNYCVDMPGRDLIERSRFKMPVFDMQRTPRNYQENSQMTGLEKLCSMATNRFGKARKQKQSDNNPVEVGSTPTGVSDTAWTNGARRPVLSSRQLVVACSADGL